MRSHALLVALFACKGATVPVPEGDTDVDTDTDTDTDTDADPDGDGRTGADDCDESDATVYVGAPERCDGVDNDCDGSPGEAEEDDDLDGALDCAACDAAGFYQPTLGLSGEPLRSALRDLMAAQGCNDYSAAREFMFNTLDVRNDGLVECVYTGTTDTPDGGTTAGVLNTEHTWPQSQGADVNPARCDLHHLYPTDADTNSRRSNHDYDIVTAPTWQLGGSKLGDNASGELVFEPRDAHKGNAARSLLYFSVQYDLPMPTAYQDRMVAWSHLDPVDQRERDRTLAIAQEQGAANALVVCPHLIDRL